MQHVSLAEGTKHNRRSVADAIEVLVAYTNFQVGGVGKIAAGIFPFPSKDPLAQLCVGYTDLAAGVTFLVWLPICSRFQATYTDQQSTRKFGVFDLNDATVDFSGNVFLTSGARLRGVEVVPAKLPYELSDLERRIIWCTIQFMKIENKVVRTLGEELDPELRKGLPTIRRVDFQRLHGLVVPSLESIRSFILENEPGLRSVSLEKISSTLSKCGMRPVVRRRPPAATRTG
jgi:hypothetical protein